MRKVFYLLGLLSLVSLNSKAVFYQVTAGSGSNQVLGGVTVNVTGLSGPYSGAFCGAGPYGVGETSTDDGWRFTFSTGITHTRVQVTSLNDADTVVFSVNGVKYNITPANLSNFGGTCALPAAYAVSNGELTVLGQPTGQGGGVQVDIQASPTVPITQFEMYHYKNNPLADGVFANFWFQNDSCQQTFQITADSPRCAGRTIQFHASPFPNTTFSWTGPGGYTATGPDPYITLSLAAAGNYTCTATRGSCNYSASYNLFVDLTPSKPSVFQKGPKCPGLDDSISAASTLGSGGYYQWFNGPAGFNDTALGQYKKITNVQPVNAGYYYVYAVSTNGCISDTAVLNFTLQPPSDADFTFNLALGCQTRLEGMVGDADTLYDSDTAYFINNSTGATNYTWTFGDTVGASSNDVAPEHYYHQQPASYTVTLIASNSFCADTMTQVVAIDHPIEALFTYDFDSICQYNWIKFVNGSIVTPTTTPKFEWNFGDGSPTRDSFDVTYRYDRFGEYDMYLVVKDYIGCTDTLYHRIVVDSTGAIVFAGGDSNLCVGQVINFSGYYNPVYNKVATWDLGDNNFVKNVNSLDHAYDAPGTYTVKFSASYRLCPDTTFSSDVKIKPYPTVDLGHDTAICPNGEPILLQDILNISDPNVTWRWNTPTKDSTPAIKVYHPGRYSVTATLAGCSITDSVEVFKNCYIDIPNVFTPNGDGTNDYFLPRQLLSKNISKFNMTIFNRWGTIVFKTNSINGRGWDGKYNDDEQPNGVYIYLIEASFGNGDKETYQGNVTLLR